MKRSKIFYILSVAFVFPLIFNVISAAAHGTDCRVNEDIRTITFDFFYDDREPMQYCEVLVFSPLDEKIEYQNGRTDSKGRFSFSPDTPGQWRIEVSDGMGHMVKGAVNVEADTSQKTAPVTQERKNEKVFSEDISKTLKVILGLSLIINIWALFSFLKTRSVNKKAQ